MEGANAIVVSDLAEVTWEQVALSLFADAAVAISYVLLLFIIVFLNREKSVSIFLPRSTYFYAFAVVLLINGAASLASLFMTGAAITLTYKLLVASLMSFTAAAVWRVLPHGKRRAAVGKPANTAPETAAAGPALRQNPDAGQKTAAERHLKETTTEPEKEIGERRLAEEHALDAWRRAEVLLLRSATPAAVLDNTGAVLAANAALAHLLGKTSVDDLSNQTLSRLLGMAEERPVRQFIQATLQHGTYEAPITTGLSNGPARIDIVATASTRDGRPTVTALLQGAVQPAPTPTPPQNDETAAAALEATRKANAASTEFMAKVNHELRTPLNGIIGMSEVLRHRAMGDRLAAADVLRMTENIHQSGTHLLSLVDDLLDLSRLEAGKRTLAPTVICVREEIQAATATLASLSDAKRIRILIQCTDDLEWTVDRRAFKQIVINLVNNAVKFSPAGSRVSINVTHGTEVMRLSVIDEGPGIGPEDRTRILLPFSRGEAAASQKAEGVGLGLAIVSELLRLQGGSLEIGDAEGGGATFTAIFSVGAAVQPARSPVAPAT